MNEFRVLGPPGCGKTTYLSRQIENAAEKHGSENVIVASYTRTAANVLNRRGLPIPRENIGTLHSLCYRCMKNYEIAEVNAAKFNEQYPEAAITVNGESRMDEMATDMVFKTDGDKYMAEYNICRAKLQPVENLSKPTIRWIKKWESWKLEHNYVDFTDMIEITIAMGEPYPGNPRIGIYDEVQDFNALEMKLIRHWAKFQDQIILAGDDDQVLFDFAGASPEAFLYPPIDDAHKRVLNQSWRLPRKIHEYSQRWIKQIKNREPKEFLPKSIEGEILHSIATYKAPHKALELAEKYISNGKTVMMLSSCGYLLEPLKKLLKSSGITFHNPYRPSRGDWNPMGHFFHRHTNKISTMERLLAFLNTDNYYWSGKDLSLWLELVKQKGVMKKYAKDRIQDVMEINKGHIFQEKEFYADIFEPFALEHALNRDLVWFKDVLLASKRNAVEYPLTVYSKKGKSVLEEKPKLIIGTIHCSPPDEKVLTTDGYVEMQDLDPNKHRLAGYMTKCNRLTWGGLNSMNGSPRKNMGYRFIKAKNPYTGQLIILKTETSTTRVTPNHKVQVRFTKKFFEKWVVYLMKRGDWWRVGICVSGHRPYRSGGIAGRLATEQADCAWILKVCCSREEAIYHESIIQGKFGIPGLTFESAKARTLSSEMLHKIHDATKESVNKRIDCLCSEFGILKDMPLWTRQTNTVQKRNMRGMFLTAAANIIGGYMEVLTVNQSFINERFSQSYDIKPIWMTVDISKQHYNGDVYSLDVEPYHHYVSGGTIVHNSVKGGEADVTILFPDMSLAAYQDYKLNPDSTIRTFYVGMTRARETLILCQPNSELSVRLQ